MQKNKIKATKAKKKKKSPRYLIFDCKMNLSHKRSNLHE